MHYLGVAFLACWQGRRESWPTPHTRATFLPEGERERGRAHIILSFRAGWKVSPPPVYLLAAFRFVCTPKGPPPDLEICTLWDQSHLKGLKDKQPS